MASLFFPLVGVVVCGCALTVVVLDVAIIVEVFKALGSRSWRLACGLVLISVIAGALWSEFQNRLVTTMLAVFLLNLLPVIKFSICWHRNSMPEDHFYATALKMSFMPCCLLAIFGALMSYAAIISPEFINNGTD